MTLLRDVKNKNMFPPLVSVLLDFLRFGLALTVLLSHVTQRPFQSGWPDLTNWGTAAVGSFFVLSGLVIRALESRGIPSVQDFCAERAARLLSVTLIAIASTCLCDFISYRAAPDFYLSNWGQYLNHPLGRLIANVVMVNEPWKWRIHPFSNSPFWSIGYEFAFYLIWGFTQYARGRAKWLALAVALLNGPEVVAMMLFWYLGVQVFDIAVAPAERTRTLGSRIAIVACPAVAVISFALVVAFNARLYGPGGLFNLLSIGRMNFFDMGGAVATYLVLLPTLFLLVRAKPRLYPRKLVHVSRFIGEMTFPLYLLHFPLLVLARSLRLYDADSSAQRVALMLVIIVVSAVVVPLAERLKRALRSALRNGFARLPPLSPA
jgi:peptidoglycan/LPS O-acetylase OafA/YrhL